MPRIIIELRTAEQVRKATENDQLALRGRKVAILLGVTIVIFRLIAIVLEALCSYQLQLPFDNYIAVIAVFSFIVFWIVMIRNGEGDLAYLFLIGGIIGVIYNFNEGIGEWLAPFSNPLFFTYAIVLITVNAVQAVFSIILLWAKAPARFFALTKNAAEKKFSKDAFASDSQDESV